MKLNKTFGRVATTLVATAMLASMAVVPASAVGLNEDGYQDNMTDNKVTFTKTYKMPEKVAVPDIDFTFSFTADEDVNEKRQNADNMDVAVQPGKGTISAVTITAEGFTDSTVEGHIATYTQNVEFTLPAVSSFSEPGVYKYDVTESPSVENSDLKMAGVHALYVFVENGKNGLEITGVEFADKDLEKTTEWVNYYMLEGDPDDPDTPPTQSANELTVAKFVDGAMANMSEEFEFTITVPTNKNLTFYKETATDANENGTIEENEWNVASAIKLNTLADLKLKNNERVHIYGLANGDSYTIHENAINSDGYKTKVIGATDNVSATFGEENVDVVYTNTRKAVSPTGLVMDVAPYALLVVVAAAGCFVFLRKRRED